jgi:GNAT superfamily N-acetyltransferase
MLPTKEVILQALEYEMLAHHLPFSQLKGSVVHTRDDCFCYESKVNFGAYGAILAQRFTTASADRRIEQLNAIIKRSGKDLGWVLSPLATPSDLERRLVAAGGTCIVELTGMALDMAELAEPPAPPNFEICLVEDEGTLEQYARIYPLLYNVPVDDWIEELVLAEREIFRDRLASWNRWVGYENGNPIAACRTGQHEGMAALQILCTLPEARNRGMGQALATHALRHEKCETAILWAGPDADRLYSRMGFQAICKTRVYVFN